MNYTDPFGKQVAVPMTVPIPCLSNPYCVAAITSVAIISTILANSNFNLPDKCNKDRDVKDCY